MDFMITHLWNLVLGCPDEVQRSHQNFMLVCVGDVFGSKGAECLSEFRIEFLFETFCATHGNPSGECRSLLLQGGSLKTKDTLYRVNRRGSRDCYREKYGKKKQDDPVKIFHWINLCSGYLKRKIPATNGRQGFQV